MQNKTLDPNDWGHLRREAHVMLDDMLDYLATLSQRPVWNAAPENIRSYFLDTTPPSEASDLMDVYHVFKTHILPYTGGNVHPRFMGWVQGGGTPVGMLAEMLAGTLNVNAGGRAQTPLELEKQVAQWMSHIFKFPTTSSGLFVTGTSMANFLALLAARYHFVGPSVREQGIQGHHLVGYTSVEAHGCVAQAFDLAGLGRSSLRMVPSDVSHRMRVDCLERMIADDLRQGKQPFFLVATAGTVDVGAIDPLVELSHIAQAHQLWFHIDGAYAALGMMHPLIAQKLQGIEHADSIAFDFHKWGQVQYDAGFVLMRDKQTQLDTFASHVAYLSRSDRGLMAGSPWPCDLGPDLSRGFRALKTWFTLKTYGTQQLGEMMYRTCMLACYLGSKIEQDSRFELLAPVELNIVCFRYVMSRHDLDELNQEIVVQLHEQGIAVPSTTSIRGKHAIRVAVVNHRTQQQDIDSMLAAVISIAQQQENMV